MTVMALLQKRFVGSFRETALVVEQMENAAWTTSQQIEDRLIIELIADFFLPYDLFAIVFVLFGTEYGFDEVGVEAFVGVVDAKLLETVGFEALKHVFDCNLDDSHAFRIDRLKEDLEADR